MTSKEIEILGDIIKRLERLEENMSTMELKLPKSRIETPIGSKKCDRCKHLTTKGSEVRLGPNVSGDEWWCYGCQKR